MAARTGRQVTLTWGGQTIPGVRQKGMSVNGAPVDITSDDDAGWRNSLDGVAGVDTISVSIKLSGVAVSGALKTDALAFTKRAAVLTYPDGYLISGNFIATGFSENEDYKGETPFECTLESVGAVTGTPGSTG